MPKVMIAEDDVIIADMMEDVLLQSGYEVCGIARTVAEGIALGERHKPDLAVLDLRLAEGGLGTAIAEELASSCRIGILYATGNLSQVELIAGDACLVKPFGPDELTRSLEIVSDIVATGKASPPFPSGFHVLRAVAVPRRRFANE